ncbi:hypothetical protein [Agromyces sp. Leaf222]|uniref:hypothetical protein n=1 Tax=Agromyces sp. Leaf222 TaxID=1735688 RepID=UPI0006F3447F|nr:hypothetical protein [Agromyces sp. Leaf222]KQM82451.1 hypothetical protein ASE68_03435 [Agromyces sp. Leaf222]
MSHPTTGAIPIVPESPALPEVIHHGEPPPAVAMTNQFVGRTPDGVAPHTESDTRVVVVTPRDIRQSHAGELVAVAVGSVSALLVVVGYVFLDQPFEETLALLTACVTVLVAPYIPRRMLQRDNK